MKYDYKGLTISIESDDSPESPREWDNLGTMVCFHGRYILGDKDHGYRQEDYSSWADLEAAIRANEGEDAIILPLWLYDHSGISMSCGERGYPYDCRWDSGQVGFIFVRMAKVREEFPTPGIHSADEYHDAIEKKGIDCLKGEVATYDQFLRGDVYGYSIADEEGEHGDSCWGFYGMDHCKEEAESSAEWHAKDRQEAAEKACHEETEKAISLLGF